LSDKQRRNQAETIFRRHKYLSRLFLQNKKGTTYIYFCNKHKLHRELFEIKCKDENNKQQMYHKFLTVPVDTTSKTRHTRSTAVSYKPALPKTRKKREKMSTTMIQQSPTMTLKQVLVNERNKGYATIVTVPVDRGWMDRHVSHASTLL
jgi:hypothetical protein